MHISPAQKSFANTFLLVVLYAVGFYGLQFFLFETGLVKFIPDALNLRKWDAGWYHTLSETGYTYDVGAPNNLVFFPLFPLIWHIAHVGVWGMSVLNTLFFATGFSILCSMYKPDTQNKVLWLSLPCVYFVFIPYTEALFFLLGTIAFYGIKNKKKLMVWVALFLLSLTRPTGVLLGPAFLAMSLISNSNKTWHKSLLTYLTYLLPMALGMFLFFWYEYTVSGKWFVFFEIEKIWWGHTFNWPVLPFGNHYNYTLTWISAAAMFVSFFSLLFLFYRFIRWLVKNETIDEVLALSCGYLIMSMMVIILYNPAWGAPSTNIAGIFRYTLMTPFFFVFLDHFTNKVQYTWKNYLLIFFIATIVWLSFGAYVHIQHFLYFQCVTLLIFAYMLHANKKLQWPILILAALNVFFQVQYFQQFIGDIFPD